MRVENKKFDIEISSLEVLDLQNWRKYYKTKVIDSEKWSKTFVIFGIVFW